MAATRSVLRFSYAMSGTEIAVAATRRPVSGLAELKEAQVPYAITGTDIAYQGPYCTLLRDARLRSGNSSWRSLPSTRYAIGLCARLAMSGICLGCDAICTCVVLSMQCAVLTSGMVLMRICLCARSPRACASFAESGTDAANGALRLSTTTPAWASQVRSLCIRLH
eukprot:1299424-Rhodomonas_salina.1